MHLYHMAESKTTKNKCHLVWKIQNRAFGNSEKKVQFTRTKQLCSQLSNTLQSCVSNFTYRVDPFLDSGHICSGSEFAGMIFAVSEVLGVMHTWSFFFVCVEGGVRREAHGFTEINN